MPRKIQTQILFGLRLEEEAGNTVSTVSRSVGLDPVSAFGLSFVPLVNSKSLFRGFTSTLNQLLPGATDFKPLLRYI